MIDRSMTRNRVRIIGGEWRSRLVQFPDTPGLRPTPDRVRETLFNWLGQRLDGLACLDLSPAAGRSDSKRSREAPGAW
jgi:16S rRNA (guanine966-N2)-methyltransferase